MAPEQALGERVDALADIYALGATLFKALTGRVPFPGEGDLARIVAKIDGQPPLATQAAPGIPPAFDAVIARAMARDPRDRYATAGELGRTARAAAGQPSKSHEVMVAIGPGSMRRRLPARGGRRRGRDGRRLPGDPAQARPDGRAQADVARARRRSRLPHPLRARVEARLGDRPPQRDPDLRGRRGRRPALHRDALRRRRHASRRRCWPAAGSSPTGRSRCSSRSPRRSTPPTPVASSTATSSRATC